MNKQKSCFFNNYTLAEIVIVLVILSLVTSLVFRNFTGIPEGAKIRQSKDIFLTAFYTASSMSLSQGKTIYVRWDIKSPSLILSTSLKANKKKQPEGIFRKTFKLPRKIKLEEFQKPILFIFYSSGDAEGPFVKYSTGKRNFELTVDEVTGKALIHEKIPGI